MLEKNLLRMVLDEVGGVENAKKKRNDDLTHRFYKKKCKKSCFHEKDACKIHPMKINKYLCALAIAGASTVPLSAATLLDNTSAGISVSTGISFDSDDSVALLFSTGSTAYDLRSIEFAINSVINETGSITLSLYSGATPSGTAVASQTFSGISFTSTGTALTKNLSDAFAVAANSNYTFLLATSVSFGRLFSTTTGANLSGGTSGLTYLGRKFSPNGGASWNGPFTSATPYMKLTDTVAVPEPSAFSLLAIGLGGLAILRRRLS